MKNIDLEFGYPFCISVRSIPIDKKEEEKPLKPLKIYHDIRLAIQDFVEITHEKYVCAAKVTLSVMSHKKATDGIYEPNNDILAVYKVYPPKKIKTKKEKEG